MTVTEIIEQLRPVKPMSRWTLYQHIRALKIKPLGVRQKPQRYPEETPAKILQRLGYKPKAKGRR